MNLDFADLKPSVLNWMVVGLMSTTFILLMKWLSANYLSGTALGGISDAFNAV